MGFLNLQSAEIQKTGLRSSESSGSWNGPDKLALMFILHCSMSVGRLSLKTSSLSPYPTHSKENSLVEMTRSVSPITSTPCMESKSKCRIWLIMLLTINYRNCYVFHTTELTYHWSSLWKFVQVCEKLLLVLLGAENIIKFVESLNTTIQSILTSNWIRLKRGTSSILSFKLMNHEHRLRTSECTSSQK